MTKILFIQDYVRVEAVFSHKDGTATLDYKSSPMGKKLKEKMERINLTPKQYDVAFVYPKVPEPNKIGRGGKPVSYKDPKAKEVAEFAPQLLQTIVQGNYDVIVPMGKLGCKALLGTASITKLRGVPEEKTITFEEDSVDAWVLPMFSMEYISAQPNVEGLLEADVTTLGKYLTLGDKGFLPTLATYEYVDTIERVREIFAYLKHHKPLTAWDLETNTLEADMLGAKPIVISLSWEEAQGVTIPWDHKDHSWTVMEKYELEKLIEEFMADSGVHKVLHNGTFDIHFLMSTKGFKTFEHCRDTKVAYYLCVTQEAEKSFRLSDLAYEMTDMGGYDKPLEDWKNNFIKEHAKDKEDKPVNEVDGSNFNYEWIPLELLHPYAAGDTDCCLRIHNILYETIKTYDKWDFLFTEFYPALTRTLARIQSNGFMVDTEYLNGIDVEYEKEEQRMLEKLRTYPEVQELEEGKLELYNLGIEEFAKPKAERDPSIEKLRTKYKDSLEFNPNSADDKGILLYQIMNVQIPPTKEALKPSGMNKPEHELEWTDFKTDKFTIGWIKDNIPEYKDLATDLLAHSSVRTLRNNFTKKLPKMVSNKDGCVHAKYNSTGTSTSRLSANNPNFQQMASGSHNVNKFDYHYPIKRAFVSRFENGGICQADYSALRIQQGLNKVTY